MHGVKRTRHLVNRRPRCRRTQGVAYREAPPSDRGVLDAVWCFGIEAIDRSVGRAAAQSVQ